MSGHTLLLNADYNMLSVNPLSTVNWQNAIKLQFTENATVFSYYDDWTVHSPSVTLNVPAVMVLKNYRKFNRGVKFSIKNLLLRDNYTCQYCEKKFPPDQLTKDHVKPRAYGGKTNWENIVIACSKCNHKRGHNESIRPKCDPYKPSVYEINAKMTNNVIQASHESWVQFLSNSWDESKINVMPNVVRQDFINRMART